MGKPTLIELPAENRPNPWPALAITGFAAVAAVGFAVVFWQIGTSLALGIVIVSAGISVSQGLRGLAVLVHRWKLGRAAEIAATGHAQAQVLKAQAEVTIAQAERLQAAAQVRQLTDGSHERD